jgi:hypothetical protein
MNIALALVTWLVLNLGWLALAPSHNRPFDAITRRSDRTVVPDRFHSW